MGARPVSRRPPGARTLAKRSSGPFNVGGYCEGSYKRIFYNNLILRGLTYQSSKDLLTAIWFTGNYQFLTSAG